MHAGPGWRRLSGWPQPIGPQICAWSPSILPQSGIEDGERPDQAFGAGPLGPNGKAERAATIMLESNCIVETSRCQSVRRLRKVLQRHPECGGSGSGATRIERNAQAMENCQIHSGLRSRRCREQLRRCERIQRKNSRLGLQADAESGAVRSRTRTANDFVPSRRATQHPGAGQGLPSFRNYADSGRHINTGETTVSAITGAQGERLRAYRTCMSRRGAMLEKCAGARRPR